MSRLPWGPLGASLTFAVLVSAALIAASVVGARSDGGGASPPAAPSGMLAGDRALLRGIRQEGTILGSPSAPVTLVEYADLQCPYCAQWAREAFPELARDYIRTGRVRMVFRGLAFLGPESEAALRAALAAAEQGRLWTSFTSSTSIRAPRTGAG